MRSAYPEVDASGFDEAYARATAVTTPLTVRVEDRTWEESPASLSTLVIIDRVTAKPGELPAIPGDAIAPSARYRYTVSLANERVASWVAALGAVLDHPGKSAKFRLNAEQVVSVIPSESGVRIDQEKLRALFLDELVRPAGASREIAAPAAVDKSAFTTEQANELAAKISRTSTFTTSYPPSFSRHANISTGASQFDGVVIMPGQTFSFWELLGPVTVERGYTYAGAIINNRSDENVIGGGLCQVSTTIFNAVSRQGYEIVERHAHGYYIDRYPIGYDAAVFEPGVDFKWRNDTANPVFIYSWSGGTSLTIDVWGIPTGRTVAISDPVQRNFVHPAADQLAIGRGVVGIADHHHAGAGIADAGEIVEALEDVAGAVGFDHDHIRRRHRVIDFDRRGEAAALGGEMRLGETAILPGRGHRGERLLGLAKCLNRDARNRRNVILGVLRIVRFFVDACHLPVSLSLALSASG